MISRAFRYVKISCGGSAINTWGHGRKYYFIFYGSPSGGFSELCAAPSGKVTELLAVLVGEIYPFIQLGGLEQ